MKLLTRVLPMSRFLSLSAVLLSTFLSSQLKADTIVGDEATFSVPAVGAGPATTAITVNPTNSVELGDPGGPGVQYIIDVFSYEANTPMPGEDSFLVDFVVKDNVGAGGAVGALAWNITGLDWRDGGDITSATIVGVEAMPGNTLPFAALPTFAGLGNASKEIAFGSTGFDLTGPVGTEYVASFRFISVPEPSSAAAIFAAAGWCLLRRKRRAVSN